nr:MAG TPA: hypothetical protein [Caudoviricetes sp.]
MTRDCYISTYHFSAKIYTSTLGSGSCGNCKASAIDLLFSVLCISYTTHRTRYRSTTLIIIRNRKSS